MLEVKKIKGTSRDEKNWYHRAQTQTSIIKCLRKRFLIVLIFSLPKTMFKVYKSLITHRDRGTQVEIVSNNFIGVLQMRVKTRGKTCHQKDWNIQYLSSPKGLLILYATGIKYQVETATLNSQTARDKYSFCVLLTKAWETTLISNRFL